MNPKRVTLTKLLNPDKKIVAIKNLRGSTRPPAEVGGTVMGLKDAKDVVDRLVAGSNAEVVEVWDTDDLYESFIFVVHPEPEDVLDKGLVMDFLLDVLATADPETAYRIMSMKTYVEIKNALR